MTDDSLDFCPECKAAGASVLLPSPNKAVGATRVPSGAESARSVVGGMFVIGTPVTILGAFILASASTEDGRIFGIVVIVLGGILVGMALTAIAASLGVRMTQEE